MHCLQSYVEHNYPQSPGRFADLLSRLPEVLSKTFEFLIEMGIIDYFFNPGPIGCYSVVGEQNVLRSFLTEFGHPQIASHRNGTADNPPSSTFYMNKKAQQRRDTTTGATQQKTKQKLVVEREQAQKKT